MIYKCKIHLKVNNIVYHNYKPNTPSPSYFNPFGPYVRVFKAVNIIFNNGNIMLKLIKRESFNIGPWAFFVNVNFIDIINQAKFISCWLRSNTKDIQFENYSLVANIQGNNCNILMKNN